MASSSSRGVVPPPAGVEANFVNPEYRSGGIVPITAVFVTLSTVFLALRIYTKARIIKIFGLEDAKFWNPLLEGQCLNSKDLFLWNSILNVFADFLVLILPIPMLRKLQMGMRQKWIIGLLFGVGSLTCIVSAVRTYYVALLFGTTDTSWILPTPTSLVVVETNLCVICGCIMVLRPFVRRRLPFLLGSESKRYRAGAGVAIFDGYQRSETKTKISGGKHQKHSTLGSFGGKIKSWVGSGGGARTTATGDTDSTFVSDGWDVEMGKVGWPLESGRGKREVKSETEENIIERPPPTQGGIIKTVNVDVNRG
ncbi:MAG: hypothetical protein LQ337_008409 [Flavoplaca oasis]|nr:MAG: hypothetical protein LQ337_008409 [Flavoplaca oasis]